MSDAVQPLDTPIPPPPRVQATEAEHPEYGTCPRCVQAVRVLKSGFLREHKTSYLAVGFAKAQYQCPGAGRRYAEFEQGTDKFWDLASGDWRRCMLRVPVWTAYEDGSQEWRETHVPHSDALEAARDQLWANDLWRIELKVTEDRIYGTLRELKSVTVGNKTTEPAWLSVIERNIPRGPAEYLVQELLHRVRDGRTDR